MCILARLRGASCPRISLERLGPKDATSRERESEGRIGRAVARIDRFCLLCAGQRERSRLDTPGYRWLLPELVMLTGIYRAGRARGNIGGFSTPMRNKNGEHSRVSIDLGRAAVPIDIISIEQVIAWIKDNQRDCWEVMVTPNLHHLRVIRSSPDIAERYTSAALSLADGWPVAWLASRVSGRRVERVVGENVFEQLIAEAGRGAPLVLVGGTEGAKLDGLLERCRRAGWEVSSEPALRPELDDPQLRSKLVTRVARAGNGGVVVLGVGAPRQEQLAAEISAMPGHGALLCLGMSINFSSGVARGTPKVLQNLGLEWAYRASQEPRRLMTRYAMDSTVLPALLRQNRRQRTT